MRSQVAHNFDQDEYQEPEYIKSTDIIGVDIKEEEYEEDHKPPIILRSHSKNISMKYSSMDFHNYEKKW